MSCARSSRPKSWARTRSSSTRSRSGRRSSRSSRGTRRPTSSCASRSTPRSPPRTSSCTPTSSGSSRSRSRRSARRSSRRSTSRSARSRRSARSTRSTRRRRRRRSSRSPRACKRSSWPRSRSSARWPRATWCAGRDRPADRGAQARLGARGGRHPEADDRRDREGLGGRVRPRVERLQPDRHRDHQRDADAAERLRSIFQNITLDFIASKLKELQHHAAIELAKRGITTATAAHKVATEAGAALKSLAITAASAIKEIAIHAARAAAAAFAAIAGIPFVGPFLAPIAAGVALASVLALGGRIASAEGGYDIPHGLNPITQLHQDEMVLPARSRTPCASHGLGGSGGRSGGAADAAPLPRPRGRREELRGAAAAESVGARQGRAGRRAQRPPRAHDVAAR
jgi:hypothetical protein